MGHPLWIEGEDIYGDLVVVPWCAVRRLREAIIFGLTMDEKDDREGVTIETPEANYQVLGRLSDLRGTE